MATIWREIHKDPWHGRDVDGALGPTGQLPVCLGWADEGHKILFHQHTHLNQRSSLLCECIINATQILVEAHGISIHHMNATP